MMDFVHDIFPCAIPEARVSKSSLHKYYCANITHTHLLADSSGVCADVDLC